MYTPKFFETREFVPKQVYAVRGEKSLQLMDDRILITSDQCRTQFGRAVINTWFFWNDKAPAWIGRTSRNWSGLRIKGCPYGSQFSQHRHGRAFDMLFEEVTAQEAREYILANPDKFPYITSLEKGVGWLHVDCRNVEPVMTYKP